MDPAERLRLDTEMDPASIASNAAKGLTSCIQFWQPNYDRTRLARIEALCQTHGPKLQVRFYHHPGAPFDAATLRHIPSVQNLAIDCLDDIVNEDLNRPSFLAALPVNNLEVLTLMGTRKNNLDLTPLAQAASLRKLTIESHRRGIEALAAAPRLEELALWGIPRSQPLDFIAHIKPLLALSLIRGGRETLHDLTHDSLKFLHLTWINGLRDLGPIGRFPSLKGLAVSDQLRLDSLDLTGANLQFLALYNCKNLVQLTGLDNLQRIEQFTATQTALPLDPLRDRTWPASLRVLRLWSTSMKWNRATEAHLTALGYQQSAGPWYQSGLDETFG
jgi:protein phosphatase 1 regulatory subunit 7